LKSHLFFTGLRGTGKTSVGSIVAQSLGIGRVDLDDRVERDAGQPIGEVFRTRGESGFRDLESAALLALPVSPPLVITLGGGAILRAENRRWIERHGVCIWLDASPEVLAERIAGDQATETRRPALTELSPLEEIRQLSRQRQSHYQAVADHRVETDGKSVQQVAQEVLAWIASESIDAS
jgi:shikimate kinase